MYVCMYVYVYHLFADPDTILVLVWFEFVDGSRVPSRVSSSIWVEGLRLKKY